MSTIGLEVRSKSDCSVQGAVKGHGVAALMASVLAHQKSAHFSPQQGQRLGPVAAVLSHGMKRNTFWERLADQQLFFCALSPSLVNSTNVCCLHNTK
eukprot:352855-Pelagomonas_calceolata.AAC.6